MFVNETEAQLRDQGSSKYVLEPGNGGAAGEPWLLSMCFFYFFVI